MKRTTLLTAPCGRINRCFQVTAKGLTDSGLHLINYYDYCLRSAGSHGLCIMENVLIGTTYPIFINNLPTFFYLSLSLYVGVCFPV